MFTGTIYTCPAVAVPAIPGEVIKSSNWNTLALDIAAAITQLASTTDNLAINTPRTIVAGSFTVNTNDTLIYVQGNSPTILLQPSSLMIAPVRIMGATGTVFGSNHAVVIPSGADKLSGQGTVTLTQNYAVLALYPLVAGGGYIVGS